MRAAFRGIVRARSGGMDAAFPSKFSREVAAEALPAAPAERRVVTTRDLSALPAPVRRYMTFMGVVGRARVWSFRAHLAGRFWRGGRWMPCECWQYNTRLDVARIFHMRLRMGGVVPTYVRDTYVHGHGRMRARVLDLFTIVDESNHELDVGELVTYLNDAILIAPSMLLGPETTWEAIGESSFRVGLADAGTVVHADVTLDDDGGVKEFGTFDRFVEDPEVPGHVTTRARWTTPVDGWQLIAGRRVPTSAKAVWHLPRGPLPYAELSFPPDGVVFNVPPGA
jgi:hypothetical protein